MTEKKKRPVRSARLATRAILCPRCKSIGSCLFEKNMDDLQARVPKKISGDDDFNDVQKALEEEALFRGDARENGCTRINNTTLRVPEYKLNNE